MIESIYIHNDYRAMNTLAEVIETIIPLAQIKVDSTEGLNEGLVILSAGKYYEILFIMNDEDILATEITLH